MGITKALAVHGCQVGLGSWACLSMLRAIPVLKHTSKTDGR